MRFETSHDFDASPQYVAAALLDESYQASLADISDALKKREVVSQRATSEGHISRRIRCVIGVDLGPARRFIGSAEPAWIEAATWDPQAMRWTWEVEPEIGAHLLAAHGTIALAPNGSGTRKTTSGEVRVKVPLYGGRVEKVIVEHLLRGYDDEAARLRDYLAGT